MRSVRKQGLGISRVEIDPVSGRFTIVPGPPSKPADDSNQNSWDTVLTNEPR